MGLWLAGGGIWPSVKVGLGLDGFMSVWGWYLVQCAKPSVFITYGRVHPSVSLPPDGQIDKINDHM
jgi:hypothetical protein